MDASPKLAMMPFSRDLTMSFEGSLNRRGSLTDDIVEKRKLKRTVIGTQSFIWKVVANAECAMPLSQRAFINRTIVVLIVCYKPDGLGLRPAKIAK